MVMAHEHDGSHEAIENFMKEGIMLVTQYVKHHKAQRLAEANEAARRDHELSIGGRQQRFQSELTDRLGLDRAQAALQYANVNNEEWWRASDASTILDTYKDAAMNAESDSHAAAAVEVMADYMKAHMGIDVGAISQAAEAKDIADSIKEDGGSIDEKYADHLQSDRGLNADQELGGLGNEFAGAASVDELAAALRDFHLSQALTSVADPHSIEDVAAAAEADNGTVQPRHTGPEPGLGGERDNLDR